MKRGMQELIAKNAKSKTKFNHRDTERREKIIANTDPTLTLPVVTGRERGGLGGEI
jgi:hypothetical protein